MSAIFPGSIFGTEHPLLGRPATLSSSVLPGWSKHSSSWHMKIHYRKLELIPTFSNNIFLKHFSFLLTNLSYYNIWLIVKAILWHKIGIVTLVFKVRLLKLKEIVIIWYPTSNELWIKMTELKFIQWLLIMSVPMLICKNKSIVLIYIVLTKYQAVF